MRNVEIEIFRIAQTQVDRESVRGWLDHVGATKYEIPVTQDPALLVALAAKRCYMSFEPGLNPNVSKVRKDMVEYLDNILRSGHGSVLEHVVWSFAVEGVSRVFTGEMNRHRAGWAISEGSMRYIRFDNIPWWLPLSIRENATDQEDLAEKKYRTRAIFDHVFMACEQAYKDLVGIWDMDNEAATFSDKKKITSCLRRIIPMGVATGGVWTGNARALRHVMALRTEPAAEEEIAHVFSRIAAMMAPSLPSIFGDFEEQPDGSWRPKYRKV